MKGKPIVPINCFFKGSYNPTFEEEISKCKAFLAVLSER